MARLKKEQKIGDLYSKYETQIDMIVKLMGNYRKAARVVAWFYGGSFETWRKFLAGRRMEGVVPEEVKELLLRLRGKETHK